MIIADSTVYSMSQGSNTTPFYNTHVYYAKHTHTLCVSSLCGTCVTALKAVALPYIYIFNRVN